MEFLSISKKQVVEPTWVWHLSHLVMHTNNMQSLTTKGVFETTPLHQKTDGADEAVPNAHSTKKTEWIWEQANAFWRSERRGASPASLRLSGPSRIGIWQFIYPQVPPAFHPRSVIFCICILFVSSIYGKQLEHAAAQHIRRRFFV
jgi:hypothetical protein